MKKLAIDFEYTNSAEPDMGILSCSIANEVGTVGCFWPRDPKDRQRLIDFLYSVRHTHVLIGYEIQLAEARCLAALGLNPNEWKWRDLLAEWKWLRNETNKYKYGNIIKAGKAYFTTAPARRMQKRMTADEMTEAKRLNAAYLEALQADMEDGETAAFDEAGFSLLDCCYFFEQMSLPEYREAEAEKKYVRDSIILSGDEALIQQRKDEITKYNAADTFHLLRLADRIEKEMQEVIDQPHITCQAGDIGRDLSGFSAQEIALGLGDWCARLAKYAQRGIPLDLERMDIFLEIAPQLTEEIKYSWNREHPQDPLYRVGFSETMLSMKKRSLEKSPYVANRYTKDTLALQGIVHRHCAKNGIFNWPKTRSGQYATDRKTLGTFATGENVIKQVERHQGQLSNLKAFTPNSSSEIEAFRYIGSDCRQRPDFSSFGTQTARNAHKAKSFIFANAHWMRILINPPKGMALVELDYGSEEVFIAAALSGDEQLMAAYKSNDFYMFYAQACGAYPADLPLPTEAQRDEEWFKPYKITRNIFKQACLSIQYGAGVNSIASAVSIATGQPTDKEQAQELVSGYKSTYSTYAAMVAGIRENYQDGWGIYLKSGWRLGPDSPSILSASNLPVQGTGSVILQEACKLIDAAGLEVIATMHDSITVQCKEAVADQVAEDVANCMRFAAKSVLGIDGMKIGEPEIVRHGDYWVHGKGAKDWPKYKKHFIEEEK